MTSFPTWQATKRFPVLGLAGAMPLLWHRPWLNRMLRGVTTPLKTRNRWCRTVRTTPGPVCFCLSSGHREQLMFQNIVNTDRPVSMITTNAVVIMQRWAEQGFRWILSSSPRSPRPPQAKTSTSRGSAANTASPEACSTNT